MLGEAAAPSGCWLGSGKSAELDFLEEVKVVTRFPYVNLRKDHYRVSLAASTQPARHARRKWRPALTAKWSLPRARPGEVPASAEWPSWLRGSKSCASLPAHEPAGPPLPAYCVSTGCLRTTPPCSAEVAPRARCGWPVQARGPARPSPGMARSARTLKRRHAWRKWRRARAAVGRSGRGAPRARPPGRALAPRPQGRAPPRPGGPPGALSRAVRRDRPGGGQTAGGGKTSREGPLCPGLPSG